MTETRQLELTAPAVGGEALGREANGRVVFVAGGAPGDLVEVELLEEKTRFARARLVQVLRPSPDRVEPPCPYVVAGCGGCDWQHLDLDAQQRHRRRFVADALARQAGIEDPVVVDGPDVPIGTRTSVRGVADDDGRFAFRRRRSNELVRVAGCLVAHPLVEEVMADGRFPPGAEVTIRAGARTGDRLVLVDHRDRSISVADSYDGIEVPAGSTIATEAALRSGRRFSHREEVAGRSWTISAHSFFQPGPEGAEALVEVVRDRIDRHAPGADRLVDLYAGVGLFAGTVGAGRRVVAVERSGSSITDARENLADLDVRILELPVQNWRPEPADVVIADPSRRGLGGAGARVVAATGASLCVLVTCDVGALGRDSRLLLDAGFRHVDSTIVNLFPHTDATEIISTFIR